MRLSTVPLLSFTIATASLFPVASAIGCFQGSYHFHPDDWEYCQPVTDDIILYYTPFPEEGTVMVGFHATDCHGWSALALAGNGGMKGASQIVVRKQEGDNEEWIAEDRYSTDYVTPSLDDSQDLKLLFANQTEDGETSWGVLLPMSSCDSNDYPIEDRAMYMHWAMGSDHTFGYHGSNRGQFHANLLQAPKELPPTTGLEYVDLTMPNVDVVLGEGGQDPTNPYICTFFDLKVLSEGKSFSEAGTKVHVTRFSPILDNSEFVHHMILYSCRDEREGSDSDEEEDDGFFAGDQPERTHLGIVPQCESMPRGCSAMKWPWAVGGGDLVLPDDVGMPLENRWLVLQMHYYNKNLVEGVTDSSGVRAYFSPEPRQQEAGVLQLDGGTGDWHRPPLPAGEAEYHLPTFTVPGGCTAASWKSPINVIGVIHHMHLYGTKMEIAVERDGVSMGHLRDEHHYDFNHQSLEEPEPALRVLKPGDQIIMDCEYDTSGATEDVSFGDLTQQEMCYGAVVYYPRQKRGDDFGYMQPWIDAAACTSAATEEAFVAANASLCAQNYFQNVPRFFDFEDWVPAPFGALEACNGGDDYGELLQSIPFLCPPCHVTNNCTAEEVGAHAQGFCVGVCSSALNVTTFPDLSDTTPHDAGSYGCPEHLEYFTTPKKLESAACEFRGNMNQVVELKTVDVPESKGLSLAATFSYLSFIVLTMAWGII